MLANGTGTTVTQSGGKNWYIVYPDYAFGQDMEKSFSAAISSALVGRVRSLSAPIRAVGAIPIAPVRGLAGVAPRPGSHQVLRGANP